jgi:hypothetical protein
MTMSMNTIPDAPRSAEPGKNSHWDHPAMNAVQPIATRIPRLPVFFLLSGPITRDHQHIAEIMREIRMAEDMEKKGAVR